MTSVFNAVRDLERLRQILMVLVRHGYGQLVSRAGLSNVVGPRKGATASDPPLPVSERGVRIRRVIEDLGPTFVKLGQILSTRPDVIPEDIIIELKKLQDHVPPVDGESIMREIQRELGAPVADVFDSFEHEPLASASIGQVHRATLATEDGLREVVVKVQRPGIAGVIERDLDLLHYLARIIERTVPESRTYVPTRMVEEFDRAIHAELDFMTEADNADRFRQNFEGDAHIRFPRIHRSASARRVLTMEFLEGPKLDVAVRHGASAERIAKHAVRVTIKQIFEDGFFHADPHPGNILILGSHDEPVLGVIDLGLVGRLTPRLRDLTIDLMVASVRKDFRGMADALYALSHPTRRIDKHAFEADVALLADRYLGKKLGDIHLTELIGDLVSTSLRYGLEVPPEFMMVGKALMTIEGIGKEVYPELDLYEEMRPYFMDLLKQRYSPERIGTDVMRTAIQLSRAANEIPLHMEEVVDDLRKGSLSVEVREPHLARAADQLGRRIYGSVIVASLVLAGAMLLCRERWWLGGGFIATAFLWGMGHTLTVLWFGRRSR